MVAPLRSILMLLPLAALAAAQPEGLGFNPAASNAMEAASSVYIAPENEFLYRMRNPNGSYREFQKSEINSTEDIQTLWSPNGWKGAVRAKEGLIYVESGSNVKGGRAVYLFRHGRLVQFEQKGKVQRIPLEMPRPPTDGGAPYYFNALESAPADGAARPSGAAVRRRKNVGVGGKIGKNVKRNFERGGVGNRRASRK